MPSPTEDMLARYNDIASALCTLGGMEATSHREILTQMLRIESAILHLADSQGTGPGERVRAILEGRR